MNPTRMGFLPCTTLVKTIKWRYQPYCWLTEEIRISKRMWSVFTNFVHLISQDGNTPLHLACLRQHSLQLVSLLLNYGANPNVKNKVQVKFIPDPNLINSSFNEHHSWQLCGVSFGMLSMLFWISMCLLRSNFSFYSLVTNWREWRFSSLPRAQRFHCRSRKNW
jgi:hypothetical protein